MIRILCVPRTIPIKGASLRTLKLLFLICLLQSSWLLSACQPGTAGEATPSLKPRTPTSSPPPTAIQGTAANAGATLIPTSFPTQSIQFPLHPTIEQSNAIFEQEETAPHPALLLPDSEVVYSPSAIDFVPKEYLANTSGFLRDYREYLHSTGWTNSAEIIQRVALESSINPRLLLALVEYQTGCALGQPDSDFQIDYLLGMHNFRRKGFFRQLSWAASQLSAGYYGWRDGTLNEFQLSDGIIVRPPPELNAGSVALQYYFAQSVDSKDWQLAIDPGRGITAVYTDMFGDSWGNSQEEKPLLPPGLIQPELILPFEIDHLWSYTSGPHTVWDTEGAQAALDFAPATEISGCVDSDAWVVAVADGLVVRSEFGAVIQDLSGDGIEQTGWEILYLHIASDGRVPEGVYLHSGDPIGHPSCEGGPANGTHLHIARKYNGEWISADGTIPYILSGWEVEMGEKSYQGRLVNGDQSVTANPGGPSSSVIIRGD